MDLGTNFTQITKSGGSGNIYLPYNNGGNFNTIILMEIGA